VPPADGTLRFHQDRFMPQIVITIGKAYLKGNGLRCMAPRTKDLSKPCNKLVAVKNAAGELSGNFRCPDRRCRQEIEVETKG
jgi:hypothetical protein